MIRIRYLIYHMRYTSYFFIKYFLYIFSSTAHHHQHKRLLFIIYYGVVNIRILKYILQNHINRITLPLTLSNFRLNKHDAGFYSTNKVQDIRCRILLHKQGAGY